MLGALAVGAEGETRACGEPQAASKPAVAATAAARPSMRRCAALMPIRRPDRPGTFRGVSKNHAMNTASVSTLLDVLLSHRTDMTGASV